LVEAEHAVAQLFADLADVGSVLSAMAVKTNRLPADSSRRMSR